MVWGECLGERGERLCGGGAKSVAYVGGKGEGRGEEGGGGWV